LSQLNIFTFCLQDSIPREIWDKIPSARVGNSVLEVERGPEAAKRASSINRAVRGLKSLMGEVKPQSPLPTIPHGGLKRPLVEKQVHEGRLTFNGREKVRVLAKLTTKQFSWLPDGAKKWSNWAFDNTVHVAAVNQVCTQFKFILIFINFRNNCGLVAKVFKIGL